MKIFYSWQSDLPASTHRNFVRRALNDAIESVAEDLRVDEADRPELDEATTGEAGMVDIAATILRKIGDSAAVVVDLTPIAVSDAGKAMPNPNVLFELGYAFAKPGLSSIVAVMNTALHTPNELPFDMRGKRVLPYRLPKDADSATKTAARKQLSAGLEEALKHILRNTIDEKVLATPIVGVAADHNDPSIWSGSRIFDLSIRQFHKDIVIVDPSPTRAYCRVIPAKWKVPEIATVEAASRDVLPAFASGIGNYGTVDFGYVNVAYSGKDGDGNSITNSVAAFHEESGEWWFIDGTSAYAHKDETYIDPLRLLGNWVRFIRRANQNLDRLGAPEARRLEMGVHAVQNAVWADRPQLVFRKASVEHAAQAASWTAVDEASCLREAYNKIRNGFSQSPLSQEEFDKLLDSPSMHP